MVHWNCHWTLLLTNVLPKVQKCEFEKWRKTATCNGLDLKKFEPRLWTAHIGHVKGCLIGRRLKVAHHTVRGSSWSRGCFTRTSHSGRQTSWALCNLDLILNTDLNRWSISTKLTLTWPIGSGVYSIADRGSVLTSITSSILSSLSPTRSSLSPIYIPRASGCFSLTCFNMFGLNWGLILPFLKVKSLPASPTATTNPTFMWLHTIMRVHMISKCDRSHETLEKVSFLSRSIFPTFPQMSHLNGRFSASSCRFLCAGKDCSRTFLPQMSHSTMLCSNSTTTGFEPLFSVVPLFTVLVVRVPPDGARVTLAIRFWLGLVFWRTFIDFSKRVFDMINYHW